jgi:DNA-binding beta-propeller fold protein YncE
MDRRRFLLAAAASPLALRGIPEALAAAAGPLALVTADTEAHVALVELATGRIRGRIETHPSPFSIELAGGHAVVAHTVLGVVSILGGSPLGVRHTVAVDEPRYTADARDGRHAFVTDSGRIAVHTLDLARGRIAASLKLKQWPRHISLSPDGRTLWIGLGTASEQVAVVDVADPLRPRLERYVTPGFLAHDVGFAPSGGRIWVTGGAADTIAVHEGGRFRTLAADAPPQHVTFLGGRVFVTSGGSGTLRVYDETGRALLRTTRIPVGSFNVQYAADRILTPSLNEGTLAVLDAGGALRETVHVSASCHDACLAPPA